MECCVPYFFMPMTTPYWQPIRPEDGYIDLHLHTTHSDGRSTPQQVVADAKRKGLRAIAITDHDTVSGVRDMMAFAKDAAIECLAGIEISAHAEGEGDLHLLGYGIDPDHAGLLDTLQHQKDARFRRIAQIVARLQELGVMITIDHVMEAAGGSRSLGRPHIARAIMTAGYAASQSEAFDRYLGRGKPAYIPKNTLSVQRAIAAITQAGGIPILAHPGLMRKDYLIPDLVKSGVRGLEVFHSEHNDEDVRRYANMVMDYHLLATGGSDCHGKNGRSELLIGTVFVPYELFRQLRATLMNQ